MFETSKDDIIIVDNVGICGSENCNATCCTELTDGDQTVVEQLGEDVFFASRRR